MEWRDIKAENELEYLFLCAAAHEYKENRNEVALTIVKRILDKYGVGYIDDLTGGA